MTCALSACVSPATVVEVLIDTDAPADRAFAVTATVTRTGDTSPIRMPLQIERGTGVGQVAFPTSFGVVPLAEGARNDNVTLRMEATIPSRAPGEPDIRFRRTARWSFTRGVRGQVRIFLPVRCGTITEGCATSAPCTVAALCEESGLTCGNDGTCVNPDIVPEPPSDASVRDATIVTDTGADTGIDSGVAPADSSADSASDAMDAMDAMDATRDTGVDTGVDTGADTGVDVAGLRVNGRVCAAATECMGGACVSDGVLRSVCSNRCTSAAECPTDWICGGGNRCEPPRSCTGNYRWTDWYGDGSLRLAGAETYAAVSPLSHSYACTPASARITLCSSAVDLTLTGPQSSVLLSPMTSFAGPGARVPLNIRAAGPQLFIVLANSAHIFDINVDAPNTEVVIRTTTQTEVALVGTIRARELYLDIPAGSRVVNAANVQCRLTLTTNGTYVIMGGSMMAFRSNVAAPTPPATCP